MDPVKASAKLDPAETLAKFRDQAPRHGFRVTEYGAIAGYPLFALTKRTVGPRPRIYLSAASHGDEPAGPAALLRLLEKGAFDARATWFICPLINPVGLSRGIRENGDGIDLNRDYRGQPKSIEVATHVRWLESQPRFDLVICLHEDWESKGFYLYELNPANRPAFAEPMIAAVAQKCPIDFDELIDGRPAKEGIIRPDADPLKRDLWPEALYLRVHHTDLTYTTESPSALDFEMRVDAQCAAVETAVRLLCEKA